MLHRWSSLIYRRRRLTLALSGMTLVVAVVAMALFGGALSSSGFFDPHSESASVNNQLAADFDRGREQMIFIFDAGKPVGDPSVQAAIERAVAPLEHDSRVAQVLTPWRGGNPAFISKDGKSAYAVALLNVADDRAQAALEDLQPQVEAIARTNGLTVSVTGFPAVGKDISTRVTEGIAKAESVSIPLTVVLLLLVFGTLIAAGLPLLIGVLAMVASIAGVMLLADLSFQSIFAINIITLLGLALGVDYSLFMVARFREELRARPVEEALGATVSTAGKAILFSGITVIFGLAATLFFPIPALRSMGIGGMIVVSMALVFGLTFLPAMLAIIGHRINRFDVHVWRRSTNGAVEVSRFWHGLAQRVMARPLAVLAPVLAVLLIAGTPFLHLSLTPGGTDVLPTSAPSRAASDRLRADFASGESDPIPVIVTLNSGRLDAAGAATLLAYVDQVSKLAHITRVVSIVSDPGQKSSDWTAFAGNPSTLPPTEQALYSQTVRGGKVLVQVVSDVDNAALDDVVRELRGVTASGATVQVGGDAGTAVDTIDGIKAGLAPALAFVIVGTYLILLLTFGSVFLPIKAMLMTLLSISASLGALVLVFQDGHLQHLFGFTADGRIISTTPILMFCILFGLSMDYEVLMLTRIQEEYLRTGDNRAAVAFGLERTARTITSAAAIMMVSFGAFMLADIVI
ncbi:MAG: MMPL family transporter, partial [Rhizobiales bacterium]|nr:MMPL family transporter [Hyphomicrobiales bacterium]